MKVSKQLKDRFRRRVKKQKMLTFVFPESRRCVMNIIFMVHQIIRTSYKKKRHKMKCENEFYFRRMNCSEFPNNH